jgi:hypothetical protein
MLLLAGFKGPFALSILGALAGYTLYQWLKRQKQGARWYAMVLSVVLSFALVWVTLLRSGLNDAYFFTDRAFMPVSHAAVLAKPIIALGDHFWARLCLLPVQFLLVTGIFAVPYLSALGKLIVSVFRRNVRNQNKLQVLCLAGSFISLGAYYLFDMTGRSQNYFLYFSSPLIACAALFEMTAWYGRWQTKPLRQRRILNVIVVVLLVSVMLFSAFQPMVEPIMPGYFTADEMRAVQWIIENVPDDALIAVNRHETFYMLSGYTGKQIYIEGVRYAKNSGVTEDMLAERMAKNDALFHNETDNETRLALAKEIGADYFVQWLNVYADDQLFGIFGDGFERCYSGEDVIVWRLAQTENFA